jgi:hypothetical protein
MHSPRWTEQEKQGWRHYGATYVRRQLAQLPNPDFSSPSAIASYMSEIAGFVVRGQLTPAQGNVAMAAARAAAAVFEQVNLATRLETIERALAGRGHSSAS